MHRNWGGTIHSVGPFQTPRKAVLKEGVCAQSLPEVQDFWVRIYVTT